MTASVAVNTVRWILNFIPLCLSTASARDDRRKCVIVKPSSAVLVHTVHQTVSQTTTSDKLAVDQFPLAALDKPKNFSSPLQTSPHEGQQARKDWRLKWIQILGVLLTVTKTPMGRSAVGCRRKSRDPAGSCAVSVEAPAHFLEFHQTKFSEDCNRGSLKCSHRAALLMEEFAGLVKTVVSLKVHCTR